jgi:hypothetical protein
MATRRGSELAGVAGPIEVAAGSAATLDCAAVVEFPAASAMAAAARKTARVLLFIFSLFPFAVLPLFDRLVRPECSNYGVCCLTASLPDAF